MEIAPLKGEAAAELVGSIPFLSKLLLIVGLTVLEGCEII